MHRAPVVRLARLARTFLIAVTPQAIAIAVFLAGAVLLFSGATPGLGNRLALLRDFVPLPVLELSHLLGSAVGVGLLVIAHGLYRRLHAAWWLTIWLLCAGILLSLLKGFDYEEATMLAVVVVMLVSARSRFRRRASLIEQHYSGPWIIALFSGAVDGGMAGAVRLPARALRQRTVVAICVPRLGAAQPARLAARGR